MGNGVANLHILRCFDTRHDISHITRLNLVLLNEFEFQHANLVGIVLRAGIEKLNMVALADSAVHHTEVADNASVGVEHRVENQSLQGGIFVALRSRDALHNGVENLADTYTRAGRGTENLVVVATEQFDNLVFNLIDHCRLHIDLVDYGDNFEVVLQSKVEVRDGLSLNTLRSVYNQQRTLARSNSTRHLIGEVDVSGGVDKV